MRTRTRLTTPPGQDPELSEASRPSAEVYVPGFALPEEPSVPGRYRRVLAVLAVVAVLALVAYGIFRAMTAGQTFDPALDPGFAPSEPASSEPAASPSDGLPGEG